MNDQTSKAQQMRDFCTRHRGETYNATSLARALEEIRIRLPKAEPATDGKRVAKPKPPWCSRTALRLCGRCKVRVQHQGPSYTIAF